jgi:hypothetical protein
VGCCAQAAGRASSDIEMINNATLHKFGFFIPVNSDPSVDNLTNLPVRYRASMEQRMGQAAKPY